MTPTKTEGARADDWFAALDEELKKRTEEINKDISAVDQQKSEINRTLLEDFMKVWQRFEAMKVHFTIRPDFNEFVQFERDPETWRLKDKYNFALVDAMSISDTTQDQGRVSDSIKAIYYRLENVTHLRVLFEFCEGEHYYKYSGWKRIIAQHVLYDSPIEKVNLKRIHEVLADVIKVWFESHLRRNRDVLLKHVKETYEKGESYPM